MRFNPRESGLLGSPRVGTIRVPARAACAGASSIFGRFLSAVHTPLDSNAESAQADTHDCAQLTEGEYTGRTMQRPCSLSAIEQRQRAQTHVAPKPVLGGKLTRASSGSPGTPRGRILQRFLLSALRRQRRNHVHEQGVLCRGGSPTAEPAARAESHEHSRGDERRRGDDGREERRRGELGDGAGRDENKRRTTTPLEEALGIGDDYDQRTTRGRRGHADGHERSGARL